MLTSFRGLAATLLAGAATIATPAFAADDIVEQSSAAIPATPDAEAAAVVDTGTLAVATTIRAGDVPADETVNSTGGESGFELSGNVALVSDYRFRGVSFSDGDFALQGGLDLTHTTGFYVGTWASSISGGTPYGEVELDVYAGWTGDIADGVTFDAGLLYYIYPTGGEIADPLNFDTDYFEPYASIATTLGPVGATVGVAYAWDQDSLGGDDNLYLYSDFEVGIPSTPFSLTAHLGYTDGFFATTGDGESFDWGVGAKAALGDNLTLGLNYVDTEGPAVEDFTDAGIFVTIGYSM
ncbi:TorF family putative porin [Parerythrobacter aurantius]|uniref:TorF family putative porin n=1 Tax=Parerythrobacter aurantius TaxID=3127706 RepID=UPI003247CB2E